MSVRRCYYVLYDRNDEFPIAYCETTDDVARFLGKEVHSVRSSICHSLNKKGDTYRISDKNGKKYYVHKYLKEEYDEHTTQCI